MFNTSNNNAFSFLFRGSPDGEASSQTKVHQDHVAFDKDYFLSLFQKIDECKGTCFIDDSAFGSKIFTDVISPALKEFNSSSEHPVKLKVHAADVNRIVRNELSSGNKPDNASDVNAAARIIDETGIKGCLFTFGDMGNNRGKKENFLDEVFKASFRRPVFVITKNRLLARDIKSVSGFESCNTHGIDLVFISDDPGSIQYQNAVLSGNPSGYAPAAACESALRGTSYKNTLFLVDTSFLVHESFMESIYPEIKELSGRPDNRITLTLHQSNILELVKLGYRNPELSDRIDNVLRTINSDLCAHTNFKYGEGMATAFLDSDIISTVIRSQQYRRVIVFTQDRRLANDLIRLNSLKTLRHDPGVFPMGFDPKTNELVLWTYRDYSAYNNDHDRRSPVPETDSPSPEAAA